MIGVQEVRALPEQIPDEAREPAGWHAAFSPAERLGYSGVGLYARTEPERVETSLDEPRFDVEGRYVAARFRTGGGARLAVVNCYFPKGSGRDRDNSRVPYKLDFYRAVFDRVEEMRRDGPVLVIGDYNTAHQEIDLARPKANVKNSGFLPEERAELDRWLEAGWVDTFRALHPDEPDHYSWWAQRGGARARNVGWRIDYVLASPEAMERVQEAFIWPDELGSDHCPVGVDIDLSEPASASWRGLVLLIRFTRHGDYGRVPREAVPRILPPCATRPLRASRRRPQDGPPSSPLR